jgi:outer membrane protein
MRKARTLALAGLLLSTAGAAFGEDLIAVYERALANDPQILEADATRRAALESRPQAIATLLPQISGAASYQRDELSGTSVSVLPLGGQQFISDTSGSGPRTTKNWNVALRQNVFSWANWVALRRADKTVAQAAADYAAAEESLIQRVSQRYFDVLAAEDTLEAQQASLEAISRQLEQADKRFEVGLIAITDVEEAKAARDSGTAAVIDAKRTLANSVEALREVTGQKYDLLAKPAADLPLKSPEPLEVDKWIQTAMEQNATLLSSRIAADIARDDVSSAFSGHLPSLDLLAARSNNRIDSNTALRAGGNTTSSSNTDDNQYALQLTVPLFSGGATQSRVRQSQYRWIAAKSRLEGSSRSTERQTRDAYLGVMSEISRVHALGQALESSQTALKATEAGYEVGTRTAVDVLAARRDLVQAQTNYARSRYDYILNVINLRLAAGNLDRKILEEINGWLDRSSPAKLP